MQRDYKVFLEDMLDAISKIERYTKDLSFDDFKEDEITIDATIRNLEIIGEAAKSIPEAVRKKISRYRMEEDSRFKGYTYSCIFWSGYRNCMGYY